MIAELEKLGKVTPALGKDMQTTTYIIDGMAMVQRARLAGAQNFGQLSEKKSSGPFSSTNIAAIVLMLYNDKSESMKNIEK